MGNIYINVHRSYPGNVIYLKLKGKEECHFEEHETITETVDGETRTRTIVHHRKGKNTFYRHKIPVYTWPYNEMPPGQYTFPFQFLLGGHLPGTFYKKNPHYDAKICYHLKAQVESNTKHVEDL
jgi:hypothetical protein